MTKKIVNNLSIIIILSVVIGLTISLIQFLFHEIIHFGSYLAQYDSFTFIIYIIIGLSLIITMNYINKKYKGYNGSGVPQFEAFFDHNRGFNPVLMFILISVNTFIAFFTGFALGGEGPSITLAGSIGYYFNNLFKFKDKEYIMVSCSTGFACAFIAPIAGLMHLIEENKKHLSLSLILKGIAIIIPACIICHFVFNHTMLDIFVKLSLPFNLYYLLIIPIILSIISGLAFKYLVLAIKDLNNKYHFMVYGTLILGLIMIILRRYYPILAGGGANYISTSYYDLSLFILLFLLVGRLLLTSLGTNSTLSGGIVVPILAIGAVTSDLSINILGLFNNEIYLYADTFKVCTMLSMFAVVTRCPLTAVVLGLKCGNFTELVLPLMIVILISYIITELMKQKSIYKGLASRLIRSEVREVGEV